MKQKTEITLIGIRRIQDRIRKTLTGREQKMIGDAMINGMCHSIANDLENDPEAIKIYE